MSILHFVFYFCLLIFLFLVISKVFKIATTPVHLRWELYPVPHEKGKSKYGGSYLEEPNWWDKPLEKDRFSEILSMLEEIVFLKGVYVNNRSLWWGSFPFHYALYIYFIATMISIFGLALGIRSENITNDWVWFGLILNVFFWVSAVFGVLGGAILLYKRTFHRDLSSYSNPSHYFNIILIGSLYATMLIGFLLDCFAVSDIIGFYYAVFTFSGMIELSTIGQLHFYLLSFFLFYLPFTHMTHFFAKYFTYHKIRWDDEPLFPGTKLYEKLQKQLNYPVKWSAPHIGADGTKTWLVLGTSNPFKENKKNG